MRILTGRIGILELALRAMVVEALVVITIFGCVWILIRLLAALRDRLRGKQRVRPSASSVNWGH